VTEQTASAAATGLDGLRLGKKAGTVQDRRTAHLGTFLDTTAFTVPLAWRIASTVHDWPMYANDRYGDCTCASFVGHRIIAQEFSARQREPRPTVQDVLATYSAVTGFRANDPSTDQGAYLIDVLKYARAHGVGQEQDKTPHTIDAFVRVDQHDRDELRVAARLLGGCYLGLALPDTARWETQRGLPWSDTTGQPYSWGGHAVWLIEQNKQGLKVVTWGREQMMSWAWFEEYCDESWGVVSEDFIAASGHTPQGLDLAGLLSYVRSIT
jgi:hypothetical protein